ASTRPSFPPTVMPEIALRNISSAAMRRLRRSLRESMPAVSSKKLSSSSKRHMPDTISSRNEAQLPGAQPRLSMELHRLGVKLFAREADAFPIRDFLPVFH